jgi:hypothetical protein
VLDICTLGFARKIGVCYLGHSREFHGCTVNEPENSVIVTYDMPEDSPSFSTVCNYFKFVSLHLQHFFFTLCLKLTNFTSQIFRSFFLTLSKLTWSPDLDSLSISFYFLSIYVTIFNTLSLTVAYAAAIRNKLVCFGWDFFILCNNFQFILIRLMSLISPKSSKCEKRFNLLTYY